MINSDEFSKRLQKVMDYYGDSASSFAENIGVQRSSISHILSGRNKPSLDFVMKILSFYKEVELYWLLNGKGHFPSKETEKSIVNEESIKVDLNKNSKKLIEQIVIFYSDGTFKTYAHNNQ